MSRVMSDAEIRRRKKAQGHISQTTGALGLASLGAFGASKLPGAKMLAKPGLRRIGPAANKINSEKAKGAALGLSTAGAGIGGAGSFNFASYTGAEARKKKRPAMPTVAKSAGIEPGLAGEVGIAKEWKPSASKFDAERSRMKRAGAYEDIGTVAAGGLAAGATHQGTKAGGQLLRNRAVDPRARNLPNVRSAMGTRKAIAGRHGKIGAGLLAASGVTAAATAGVKNQNRSRSWAPYAKRDTSSRSAFGVDHGE
jgi:hypothetical protein